MTVTQDTITSLQMIEGDIKAMHEHLRLTNRFVRLTAALPDNLVDDLAADIGLIRNIEQKWAERAKNAALYLTREGAK